MDANKRRRRSRAIKKSAARNEVRKKTKLPGKVARRKLSEKIVRRKLSGRRKLSEKTARKKLPGKVTRRKKSVKDQKNKNIGALPVKPATIPPLDQIVPSSLCGYPVLDKLGEGSCGGVYKTVLKDGTEAAIKIAVCFNNENNVYVDLIENEHNFYTYCASENAQSPYIPKYYGTCEETKDHYKFSMVVIEKFDYSLHRYAKNNKMTKKFIYGVGLRLIKAVKDLHELGLYHLDLKPDNVMMVPKDPVRGISLVDFGLSSPIESVIEDPRSEIYGTDTFLGSHAWNLEREDVRDELEAVGFIVAWMLIGSLPWENENESNNIMKQITDPDLPNKLATLCKDKVIGEYLTIVRNLEIDGEVPYDYLIKLFEKRAKDCAERLKFK